VDKHFFHFLLLGHFQQREQMLNVRVHAAIAQQSYKMQLPRPAALHRLLKKRHVLQLLVRDQQIDPRDVHVHDTSRAHVHMPHFAVTHLPFGQPDKWSRSVNQCIGKFLDQLVIRWLARQRDRVALRLRSVSPSIQHRQHNWLRSFAHRGSAENSCSASNNRWTSSAVL
jgi:hypothetical protein